MVDEELLKIISEEVSPFKRIELTELSHILKAKSPNLDLLEGYLRYMIQAGLIEGDIHDGIYELGINSDKKNKFDHKIIKEILEVTNIFRQSSLKRLCRFIKGASINEEELKDYLCFLLDRKLMEGELVDNTFTRRDPRAPEVSARRSSITVKEREIVELLKIKKRISFRFLKAKLNLEESEDDIEIFIVHLINKGEISGFIEDEEYISR